MSNHNIFVYGTLMDKPFVERMLGHSVDMQSAFLGNYVKLEPSFYMIFPHEGKSVKGLVIFDLSDDDVERFDKYEGNGYGYYDRQPVSPHMVGVNEVTSCEAYVGGPHMQWYYQDWLENQAQDN